MYHEIGDERRAAKFHEAASKNLEQTRRWKVSMAQWIDAQFRHAQYYESLMRGINELYLQGGPALNLALLRFDVERRNIEAGWATALALSRESEEAARLCSSYPRGGAALLNLRLPPRERVRRSEAALAASERLSDRKAISRHLGDLAAAYVSLGEAARAIQCLEKQLEIAREAADRGGEASALGNLGNAAMAKREASLAADYYKQALAIYRELGLKRREVDCLNNLGVAYKDLGELTQSLRHHEDALAIARETGYRRSEGQSLNNMAVVYRRMADHEKARTICSEALEIFREVGDQLGEAQALWSMAKTDSELGRYVKAVASGTRALSIFERLEARQAPRVREQLATMKEKI